MAEKQKLFLSDKQQVTPILPWMELVFSPTRLRCLAGGWSSRGTLPPSRGAGMTARGGINEWLPNQLYRQPGKMDKHMRVYMRMCGNAHTRVRACMHTHTHTHSYPRLITSLPSPSVRGTLERQALGRGGHHWPTSSPSRPYWPQLPEEAQEEKPKTVPSHQDDRQRGSHLYDKSIP